MSAGRRVRRWLVPFLLLLGIVMSVHVRADAAESERRTPQSYGLPIVSIHLEGTTLDEINAGTKDVKYKGNSLTIYNTDGSEILSDDDVELKGHGNTTWALPKKPYQFKLSSKQNLFGMGKGKKWLLIANYLDPTHMRNDVTYRLAKEIGDAYSFAGQFVDVYIDDEYQGNYYLCGKVEAAGNGIDLQDSDGIVMEVDEAHHDEPHVNSKLWDTWLSMKTAVNEDDEDVLDANMQAFKAAYDQFEEDFTRKNWDAIQKEIDVDSFVRYYLVSEFSANPDATVSSFYMYRDGPDDVIHAGPVWDFDMAYANYEYYNTAIFNSPWKLWMTTARDDGCKVLQYLISIPEFKERVTEFYLSTFRNAAVDEMNRISSVEKTIAASAAADSARWNNSDFDSACDGLRNWFENRISFLDTVYGDQRPVPDPSEPGGEDTPDNGDDSADPVFGWRVIRGNYYWYENSVRQGTIFDEKDVIYDGTKRGREIFDPAAKAWYWLDVSRDGAMAAGKEVYIPYIYQEERKWDEDEIRRNADTSDKGLQDQVYESIKNGTGKWVRYDESGKMLKGWVTIEGGLALLYPEQEGNIYYYDTKTGLMARGDVEMDGRIYHFDKITGALDR